MSPKRGLLIFAAAVLIFGISIYFSSRKTNQPVVIAPFPLQSASPEQPVVVEAPSAGQLPVPPSEMKPPIINPPPNCRPIPEFNDTKRELGRLVNEHELREHNVPEFLKQVNEFRSKKGIPLPLIVIETKADAASVVYNKCHPSCRGNVNAVFVSRFIGGSKNGSGQIEVLTRDGSLKKLAAGGDAGIDVMTIDELSKKGVPFRSWKVPVEDSDWFLGADKLYYPLDIEGAWLQVDTRGNWNIVAKPTAILKLEEVEPAVKLPGCLPSDHCLQPFGASGKGRHFKAPMACEPILKHSQDEPVDDSQSPDNSPVPAGGKGSEL